MELDNFKQKLEALQNIFIKNNHIEHIHGNGKELVNNDFIPISHDFSDGLYMRKMQMKKNSFVISAIHHTCLLYTSPSPRDRTRSRMPSSA